MYAIECPFCHKELVHNRVRTHLARTSSSPASVAMGMGAGVAGGAYALLRVAGTSLPGTETNSFAVHVLWLVFFAVAGAIAALFLIAFVNRHAKGNQRRRDAFLAQFPRALPALVAK